MKATSGSINLALSSREGHYPGCHAHTFRVPWYQGLFGLDFGKELSKQVEAFFEVYSNALVVDWVSLSPRAAMLIYSRVLDDEEMADMQERARHYEEWSRQKKEKRDSAKAAAAKELEETNRVAKEAFEAKEKETLRLTRVGEQCEKHHAAFFREKRAGEGADKGAKVFPIKAGKE